MTAVVASVGTNAPRTDATYFTLNNDQIAIVAFVLVLAIFALVIVTVCDGDALRKRGSSSADDKGNWRSDHKL